MLTLALECFALFGMVFSVTKDDPAGAQDRLHLTLTVGSVTIFSVVSLMAFAFMANEVLSWGQASIFVNDLHRGQVDLAITYIVMALYSYGSM